MGVALILGILHLPRAIGTGIAGETDSDALGVLGLGIAGSTVYAVCWVMARRRQRLFAVGLSAVIFDLLTFAYLPILWLGYMMAPGATAGFLMKNELAFLVLGGLVINSLALRPLYIIGLHSRLFVYPCDDRLLRRKRF